MSFNVVEKELLDSEAIYVNELKVLLSSFVDPLEKYLSNIKGQWERSKALQLPLAQTLLERVMFDEKVDVIDTLFGNIKSIYDCNSILLSSMQAAIAQSNTNTITSSSSFPAVAVLLKHMPFMKIYSIYAANFEKSNALLTRLEKGDMRFQAFLQCASYQPQCHGLNLRAFLILPIQRTPRYEILLQEMLKHCQKTCNIQDDLYLQQAVVSVRQIVSTINTSINKRDRERELLLLQEAFNVSPLISQDSPGRTLVRTGVLQKLCHNGLKSFFFVLCNDVLFYGEELTGVTRSKSKHKYSFHRAFLLRDMQLILRPATTRDHQLCFSFILRGKDKVFEVVAKTEEEYSSWIDDIIRLKISINNQNNLHSGNTLPFYTQNQVFSVNQYATDKVAGGTSAPEECPANSDASNDSDSIKRSIRNSSGEIKGIGSGSGSIKLKMFSVHSGVDLAPGVLFTTDLVDESAVLQKQQHERRTNTSDQNKHMQQKEEQQQEHQREHQQQLDEEEDDDEVAWEVNGSESGTKRRQQQQQYLRQYYNLPGSSSTADYDPFSHAYGVWGPTEELLVPTTANANTSLTAVNTDFDWGVFSPPPSPAHSSHNCSANTDIVFPNLNFDSLSS